MDELLTIEEMAAVLKVPKSWLYSRTCRNEIPHVKVGRHLRFQRRNVFKTLGIMELETNSSEC